MDILGLITLPGWLVTILLIVLILVLYSLYCQTLFWRQGIPGPRPVLYLGSLMSFIKKGVFRTDMDNAEKYGKIYGMYAGNLPALIVSDVDLIKQICIKDFSKFPNRIPAYSSNDPMMKGAMSIARDEHWKFIRTTISPTFTSGKMRQMVPLLQKCMDDYINKLKKDSANGEVIDVCKYCGSYSMDVIASTAFGMDVDAQNNPDNAFIKHAKKAVDRQLTNPLIMLIILFPFIRRFLPYLKMTMVDRSVATFFNAAVNSVIEERQTDKKVQQDLMGLLLNAHKDTEKTDEPEESIELKSSNKMEYKKRPLTNQEILANAFIFFLAGYETTANVLSFVMYCMALYPDYAEKLRTEVDENIRNDKPTYDNVTKLQYLDMFVCEVLRLYGSAARFNRLVEEDVIVGGYTIPKGVDIQFPICAIHRDPNLWPDPEMFDPERFTPENKTKRHPYAWIPFGLGPRNCVGMRFALTELKMAAVAVVQNFTVVRCDETEVPITFKKGGFIKAANGIKLKLERR